MARSMVGFDIGTQELKIVQWNGSRVRKAVSLPLPDNLVRGGLIVSYDAMADFLKTAVRQNRISARSCAVVLPAPLVYLRRLTLPAMDTSQLSYNLPYEFRDYLTMPKEKYIYDYSVNRLLRDDDGTPKSLDLTACAVARSVIDDYRTMFRKAGFKLQTALPVECAYANLIEHSGAQEGHELCLVDLGHDCTRVYIYSGSDFETSRTIDLGLSALDDLVASSQGVDSHIAHAYVQSNHDGVQEQEGAREIYQNIARNVQQTVNFYGFNHRDSNLREVWCIGGGIQYPAFVDTISSTLDLDIASAEHHLPEAEASEQPLSVFAAAIGAAIQ